MDDKKTIRKKIIAVRENSPEAYRASATATITEKLLNADWYESSTQILVYSAIRSEVNLSAFIEQAWKDGKNLYFPKVEGEDMEFYRADSWEHLAPGTFGVMEPVTGERLPRMIPFLTPILVPGVAFSKSGQRIGYGKGYYDKYLTANQKNKRLAAIGIAYAFQIVEPFETDAFDYPMQDIITD
jgi:5-formyltetrahydrofolate cyclo-ligase